MGTLVYVCPTNGREVDTGIEVDLVSFASLYGEQVSPTGQYKGLGDRQGPALGDRQDPALGDRQGPARTGLSESLIGSDADALRAVV